MNRILAGALGGLVATLPMTYVMQKMHKKLPPSQQYPMPPEQVTREILDRAPKLGEPTEQEQQPEALSDAATAAHYGYGALTGAMYPLFMEQPRYPLTAGASFGVGIWAASYLGWIPAAGVLSPATQHPRKRNRMMFCAHLVWGATTVLVGEWLQKPRSPNGDDRQ